MEILLKITNAALCDKNKLLHVNFRIRYIISPGDKVLRADNTSDMKNEILLKVALNHHKPT
jgi:hypothetical protein